MAKLTDIVSSLFNKRDTYKQITKEEKETNFFIINRYLSKFWPNQAQEFNKKEIDKSLCLDIWFMFLKDKKYPNNFWHKGRIGKIEIKKSDIVQICKENNIKQNDVLYLNRHYPNIIKQIIKENDKK